MGIAFDLQVLHKRTDKRTSRMRVGILPIEALILPETAERGHIGGLDCRWGEWFPISFLYVPNK